MSSEMWPYACRVPGCLWSYYAASERDRHEAEHREQVEVGGLVAWVRARAAQRRATTGGGVILRDAGPGSAAHAPDFRAYASGASTGDGAQPEQP